MQFSGQSELYYLFILIFLIARDEWLITITCITNFIINIVTNSAMQEIDLLKMNMIRIILKINKLSLKHRRYVCKIPKYKLSDF